MDQIGMAVAFTAGLFSFVSPCVVPLIPSYLSFLTGMSVTDLATDLACGVTTRKAGRLAIAAARRPPGCRRESSRHWRGWQS